MATQIPALTPIDPFPTRVLPQERFDTAVKTNMSQLSGMIEELNDDFIPAVNDISTQTQTDATTCTQKASQAAISATNAANSATAASTKASEASISAQNAAASASSASDDADTATAQATAATTYAQRAEAAAEEAEAIVDDIGPATTTKIGLVKPDGTTITVDVNGTISGTPQVDIATTAEAGIVKPDGTTVQVNGTTGLLSIADATTSAKGLVQLEDSTSSTSTTKAATPNSVKQAYDLANEKYTAAMATASTAGLVKPDGTTITVDTDGGIAVPIAPLFNTLSISTPTGDDVAAAHNCIYRGDDLTQRYTLAQLSTKLANGDFSDLYIGDYITYPVEIDGTSTNFNFRIAHFNYWKYMGDTPFTQNHIVFVPDTAFKNMQMQTTSTTAGGVPATLVWAALQGGLYTAVNASTCMNGHVQTHRDWIPDSVNTSAMSAAGANFQGSSVYTDTMWRNVKLGMMKESMVYGTTVFSSSGYDVGCGKSQLALFKIDPTWINGRASRYSWWLGCVSSSSSFVLASSHGGANSFGATASNNVRPYFLFA